MAWDQQFMEATKARIEAGQDPGADDLARYLEAIGEASAAASYDAEATSRHEWTDRQVGSTSVVTAEVARVLFMAGFAQSPAWVELLDGWEHVQELGDQAGQPT
jgi:hypothetical protein